MCGRRSPLPAPLQERNYPRKPGHARTARAEKSARSADTPPPRYADLAGMRPELVAGGLRPPGDRVGPRQRPPTARRRSSGDGTLDAHLPAVCFPHLAAPDLDTPPPSCGGPPNRARGGALLLPWPSTPPSTCQAVPAPAASTGSSSSGRPLGTGTLVALLSPPYRRRRTGAIGLLTLWLSNPPRPRGGRLAPGVLARSIFCWGSRGVPLEGPRGPAVGRFDTCARLPRSWTSWPSRCDPPPPGRRTALDLPDPRRQPRWTGRAVG